MEAFQLRHGIPERDDHPSVNRKPAFAGQRLVPLDVVYLFTGHSVTYIQSTVAVNRVQSLAPRPHNEKQRLLDE